jgi:chromate transport protein ChrA
MNKKSIGLWNWVCAILAYVILAAYSLVFEDLFTQQQSRGGLLVAFYFMIALIVGSAAWDVSRSFLTKIDNAAARKLLFGSWVVACFFVLYIAVFVLASYGYVHRERGAAPLNDVLLVISPILAVAGVFAIGRAILKGSYTIQETLAAMDD